MPELPLVCRRQPSGLPRNPARKRCARPNAEEANRQPSAGKRKPSQQIPVDEVRDLQDFINLTAHRRGGKTIVFYPAETLNPNAANALLKNLEEPPPSTRFMLVSHRPSYLPATIISRCQQIVLPTPQAAAAEQWLREQGIADPALSLAQTGNAPLAALALDDGEFWTQRKTLLGRALPRPSSTHWRWPSRCANFRLAGCWAGCSAGPTIC